ncbi:zinc-finger-containing protein [Acinetobacter baumannii]|uniref:zinc-finger-containing protein n=1 Tax=Acinetobacter baumannii TaxID=470 RepID=UPI0027410B04|nr:zinc-finger-containing protein [Acinetobacter baumannii]MDP7849504.1 zinc-finger-containing protein [Acinetobacter baumannii]
MTVILDINKHILPFSAKEPVVCPYCKNEAVFKAGLWHCDPCNAYGKADKQTRLPLGTMAKSVLWNERKLVHKSYGALLQYHVDQGLSKNKARTKLNADICSKLNVKPRVFNFDRFDETLCGIVLKILSELSKSCGPTCPYCSSPSVFIQSKRIFRCDPCDAQVGVHKHNNQPLGSLANTDLRQARKKAHSYFDPLWRLKMERESLSSTKARKSAYEWLAAEMGLSVEECHIGEFNEGQCQEVMRICKPYIRNVMQKLEALKS